MKRITKAQAAALLLKHSRDGSNLTTEYTPLFRVHVGYTRKGSDRWKDFASMERATDFTNEVFTRTKTVLTILAVQDCPTYLLNGKPIVKVNGKGAYSLL